jgi:pentatricopeptide repeat protein
MRTEGASPDAITFTCVLKACTNTGSAGKGIRVHNEIVSMSLPLEDSLLGTALVEMYAKCGMLARARDVLEGLPVRSVVCWSVLIEGYAQQGQGKNALQSLKRMQDEGFSPNAVTILSVLSACSRSGLLGQAQILFRDMAEEYRVWPMLKHYTCMVLAFGCAGDFDKAAAVIQAMPTPSDPALWLALLGSCRKWANVKLGTLAFDQALQLERSCGAAYVLMADIFAAAGMHEDAERIEAMRLKYADPEARGNNAVCGSMQVRPFIDFHVETLE